MNDSLLRNAYSLHQAGKLKEAARLYREILAASPKNIDALTMLGILLVQEDNIPEAAGLADAAFAAGPVTRDEWYNLGWLQQNIGRYEEAAASYDRTLVLDSRQPEAALNRGIALLHLRRFAAAIESFELYLPTNPNDAEAWISHGAALYGINALDGALASFSNALAINRDHIPALSSRAGILVLLGRYEEAIADYRALLARDPSADYAHGNLLHCQLACCDWRDLAPEKAIIAAGLRAGKRMVSPFQNVVHCEKTEEQFLAARAWIAHEMPTPKGKLWRGETYDHERIRIAYLSQDFRAHAVSYLMAGVWERHDVTRFETIAISFGPDDGSSMRKRAEKAFTRFIDVRMRSDEEIAKLIREMEIDIAVDLMGYSGQSRPGILAFRPAPIQVNHLGFPGTMGGNEIDYILADAIVVPEEHRAHYSEKIVTLPHSYMPADRTRTIAVSAPTRAELGLPEQGFVFACFNNAAKFAPEMFALWMRLLKNVPQSVLWLSQPNAAAMRNLVAFAQSHGVAPDRLIFALHELHVEDHLARLARADLFLDTSPFNAHTTACDALWAGLSVLTLPGGTFAGRVAAGLVNAVGLPEMIADSFAAYEALALKLARDKDALAGIRARLAQHRLTHPLFDTMLFTTHLEAAYLDMWRRHRRGEPPANFAVAADR